MKHIVFILFSFLLTGCAIKDIGNTVRYNIQGEYYLEQKDYEGGSNAFKQILQNDPDNAKARYFYGRFLLIEKKSKQALPHLQKAAELSPSNSKYLFWLGVGYGENSLRKKERLSYQAVLKLEPKYYLALVYLGHNFLRAKEYETSLEYYQKALDIWGYNPQALYNRGVILKKLGRKAEEKLAWLIYLDNYPSGRFARLAAERLNRLEDYSYRNHRLGIRTVTLTDIGFAAFKDELLGYSKASLNVVGATVSNMKSGILNVVVYQTNNIKLAKKRALSIRKYLYKKFPKLQTEKRVRVSWFDTPEKKVVLKKKLTIDESVQFFLTDFQGSKALKKLIAAKKKIKK